MGAPVIHPDAGASLTYLCCLPVLHPPLLILSVPNNNNLPPLYLRPLPNSGINRRNHLFCLSPQVFAFIYMQQLHDSMVIHAETEEREMLIQKPVAATSSPLRHFLFHFCNKVSAIRLGTAERTPIVTRMFL